MKLDRYTWQARVLPVYFTSASAILAIAATLPEGLSLPLASASGVVFLPLAYFFSQVGADLGKRLEPGLWRSWGGPPTTRFLRHDNDEFNAATRKRVHGRLRELGCEIPTEAEEKSDPARAVELYASAVDELRRRTRPGVTNPFPLVYKGNIEYGFRRNLLGLKKIGVWNCPGQLIGVCMGGRSRIQYVRCCASGAICYGTPHRVHSGRLALRSST